MIERDPYPGGLLMFYSTSEAVAYGLVSSHREKRRLMGLRGAFERQCQAALEREQFDLAIYMATQAQFCREAFNADHIVLPDLKTYSFRFFLSIEPRFFAGAFLFSN